MSLTKEQELMDNELEAQFANMGGDSRQRRRMGNSARPLNRQVAAPVVQQQSLLPPRPPSVVPVRTMPSLRQPLLAAAPTYDDDNASQYSGVSRRTSATATRSAFQDDILRDLEGVVSYAYRPRSENPEELRGLREQGLERFKREVLERGGVDNNDEMNFRESAVKVHLIKKKKAVSYAESVMKTRSSIFMPKGFCTVEEHAVCVKRFSTIDEFGKHGMIIDFPAPSTTFGSYDAYMQSTFLPTASAPTGDVTNVYMAEIGVTRQVNEFPFDIGFVFRERARNSTANNPVTDKIYSGRRMVGNNGEWYHFILPAHCKVGDVERDIAFRNNQSITNDVSMLFPDITDDLSTFFNSHAVKLAPGGDAYYFDPSNPVVQLCYKSFMTFEKMVGPEVITDGGITFVRILKPEAKYFVDWIRRNLLASCIANLSEFYIEARPILVYDVEKSLSTKFYSISRRLITRGKGAGDVEVSEVRKKSGAQDSVTVEQIQTRAGGIAEVDLDKSARKLFEENHSFSFTLEMMYFFRQLAKVRQTAPLQQSSVRIGDYAKTNSIPEAGEEEDDENAYEEASDFYGEGEENDAE